MKLTFRIWLLIAVVLLSLISIFSIPPIALKKGVLVSSVDKDSMIFKDGLRRGMIIHSVDGKIIEDLNDFSKAMDPFRNLSGNETRKLVISTDSIQVIGLYNKSVIDEFSVKEIPKTRIKTGLDLQGGARAIVKADRKLSEEQLNDLISISEQRLNVYGLSDVKLFKILTSDQDRMMGVEIAGSTPEDLEQLIASQGKFEAKIGNETVFIGGNRDITFVGRTGQDAFISECYAVRGGEACNFRFVVFLSEEAAKRHAEVTKNLTINGSYLSKQLDLYVDDKLITSLNIGAELKGKVVTSVQISGSGVGANRQEAVKAAKDEMKRLQTILITGSLPFKLEIVKIDRVSPRLGEQFTHQILIAGIFAFLAVSVLIFVRYRRVKVSVALLSVSISEVIIILGFASIIGWNIDLPSVAGIIATIGTGIDSQLIILDESRDKRESIKQRIKKALFIIFTAFMTTFVALLPLTGLLGFMGIGATSAGLLKGFAITTLIGISAGVFISRPAFADIIKKMDR